MIKAILLTFFVIASPLVGEQEEQSYKYKLKDYPKSESGCHLTAKAVGERFQALNPNVKLSNSVCLAENNEGYEIEVRYVSVDRVPLVSTVEKQFSALDPIGRFKEKGVCESQIEKDAALFNAETGLEVAFAFCTKIIDGSRYPYALRIDGFGETNRSPHLSGYPIFGIPENVTGQEYVDQLVAGLTEKGLTVVDVVSHSKLAYGQISVHYYAEKRVLMEAPEFAKIPKSEDCAAVVDEARTFLAIAENPPVLVYCARVGMLGVSELTAVYADAPGVAASASVESFETMESCEAQRPELVTFYQTELNRPVYGGLCTRVGKKEFRINLIEAL